MSDRQEEDEARARESRRILEGIARDHDTLGGSALARAANRKARDVTDHFAARDVVGQGADGGTDPIELWGRRIGRSLSLVGVIVLAYWLGQTLRIW
jgi:hypothetical protein